MREMNRRLTDAALSFAASLPSADQDALLNWFIELLEIRGQQTSKIDKLKAALICTKRHKAVWPVIRGLKSVLVQHGWKERGKHVRWGIVASALAISIFGLHGAGIAALGGAVGVPLWIIFGSGGTIASVIVEELSSKRS